jgi:hypothetical protein
MPKPSPLVWNQVEISGLLFSGGFEAHDRCRYFPRSWPVGFLPLGTIVIHRSGFTLSIIR